MVTDCIWYEGVKESISSGKWLVQKKLPACSLAKVGSHSDNVRWKIDKIVDYFIQHTDGFAIT